MIHTESVKQWEAETESYRKLIGELRAENERLRVALINMLDDGDETDRAAAMALINKTEK